MSPGEFANGRPQGVSSDVRLETKPANEARPDTPIGTTESETRGKSAPDEIEFFTFAKQYMGLVAGLAAVPLVTNGLGVIPTPNGFTLKDLSAVASLLCVIAFGAVFSLRHVLGRTQEARQYRWRMIPALIVLFALGIAVWQISMYLPQVNRSNDEAASAFTEQTPLLVAQYLCIQILLVFAIGIALVTAFTMQEAHQIQNMIERDMQKQRFELLERIRYTDMFYKLARTNKAFEETGQALVLNARHRELKRLAEGRINGFGDSARHLQEFLLRHFCQAFDAVSDRDLDFWKKKDSEAFSQAYDQLLATATERGLRLTRLLLFSDEQLAHWRCIAKVIRDHEERGYGWAIAPYRTVERAVLDTEHDLDFALFNGDAAISYFRDYHSSFRHLEVIFNNVDGLRINSEIIGDQAIRYLKLCAQAWACNKPFAERISMILDQKRIGAKELDEVTVRELTKCLKASTMGDTQSIPEEDRAQVRARLQKFATGSADTEWRPGMMIDSRELQGDAARLSEEDLDLIAWKLLRYRRKAPNWEGPAACDMLLITGMASALQGSPPYLTAELRGIGCSFERDEEVKISVRFQDVHGNNFLSEDGVHAFDKAQYDATKDVYQLRVEVPTGLAPGHYKWEVTASDGARQAHCERKTSRSRWFEMPVMSASRWGAAGSLNNGASPQEFGRAAEAAVVK